jgi:hypothetical protein
MVLGSNCGSVLQGDDACLSTALGIEFDACARSVEDLKQRERWDQTDVDSKISKWEIAAI